MNVTKQNFPAVLANLKRIVPKSEFVAIDAEMTGITDHRHSEKFFDSPSESLRKKTLSAKKYGLIQIGLCLFEAIPERPRGNVPNFSKFSYAVRPFNFYVFPSVHAEIETFAKTFSMDPQAVNFNKDHNMNFNRWICEGVGYCNAEHEDAYISLLKKRCVNTPVDFRHCDKELFPNVTVQRDKQLTSEHSCSEEMIDFVGIREVFKILRAAQKPLIGHNILMDILFLLEAVDSPLPLDMLSLRKTISLNFPFIWDTKVLAMYSATMQLKLKHISLQNMFENYFRVPMYKPLPPLDHEPDGVSLHISCPGLSFPLGFESYAAVCLREQKFHEAGFDAMASGIVFLNLCEDLPENVLREGLNKVALYKNFHSLNLDVRKEPFNWLVQGKVLKLSFHSMTKEDVLSSLEPLHGQIMWVDEGNAAVVLSAKHTIDEAMGHFSKHSANISVEEVLQYKHTEGSAS